VIATGLASATAMEIAPDGRIFVAQQTGALRVIDAGGTLLPTPFVTLSVDSRGERGLLGIAFDPTFATNNFVYVYYTATTPTIHNRVSRFTASGNVALPGSEQVIFELDALSAAQNHNGGAIHFGLDGKLYIAVGDNANGNNSQSLATVHGKILRINADGTIPPDNPFHGVPGSNPAIWALGLRNPFTFAVHPGTGRLFLNDAGEVTFEEINDGMAGANYGWPIQEGLSLDARFQNPLFAYGHGPGNELGCAITGGAFYAPANVAFPEEYVNDYFFAEFCNGWIRRFDPVQRSVTLFATGLSFPVDLRVGADGRLYYLARGTGSVGRIQFSGSANLTPNQRFVSRTYFDLLGRLPEPGALGFWAGQLDAGHGRASVVQAIQASAEYRGLVVDHLYETLLHRSADSGGRAFFLQQLQNGGTVDQVRAALLGSPEYFQRRGGGTGTGFLTAVYLDLFGRPIDADGQMFFSQRLASGASTRSVAEALLVSAEARQFLVRKWYGEYLHRAADPGGLGFFAGLLGAGGRDEQVMAALVASEEYFALP
jgi:glucose/arabinose dehydrogenase